MREVESLSALDLSGWTPTGENAQLPELRHNLRLIVDVAKADVDALAREGRAVNEKRRWAVREEQVARAKMEEGNKRESNTLSSWT
jgi:tuftelin-interacting protein 11